MAVRKSTRSGAKKPPGGGNEIRTHPFDVLKLLLKEGMKTKGGKKRLSPKSDAALNLARMELIGLSCSIVWCARALKPSSSAGRFWVRTLMNVGRELCEVVLYLGAIGAARKMLGYPAIPTKKGLESLWKAVQKIVDDELPNPHKGKSRSNPSGGES